jgi:hypothetical protein
MGLFRGIGAGWLCLAAAGAALAQTYTADLRGAVRTASGPLPEATVTLLNEATNIAREAITNAAGEYNFAAVAPGVYTLRATFPGLRGWERSGIRLGAQAALTIDIELEFGVIEESIEVVAAVAPLLETSTASTGALIDSSRLNQLPAPNRLSTSVAVTVPTVIPSGNPELARLQDLNHPSLVSLGGGARRANNYIIDGVPHTDLVNRPSVNVTMDMVESMNVQLHNYDAETGRTGGGTFNVASKSGSNQWHGLGFYQDRPGSWLANNFFAKRAGQVLPDTYWHNGGGALGGPLRRDRTFFYYNVEGYRNLSTRNARLRMPSSLERLGDFSASRNAANQLVLIYDPLTTRLDPSTGLRTRTPFAGNRIPASRLNPVSLKILSYYPAAQRDVSDGLANFDSTAQQIGWALMHNIKLDHRFSDKVSVSGLYITNATQRTNDNYWEPGQGPNRFADPRDGTLDRSLHLVAVNNTWITGPASVVSFRFGFTRLKDDDATTISFDPATLGLSPAFLNAQAVKKFPVGRITDYEGFGAVDPTQRLWSSWSANFAASKLIGTHTVKFGADYRRLWLETQSFEGGSGDLRFDRFFTSADPLANGTATSGNAMASFLLGYPSGNPENQSRINISSPLHPYLHYYGFFAQSDSRLRRNLTFTYGLRVEHETGLRERENRFTVGFDRQRNPGGALGNLVIDGRPVRGGLIYAGVDGAPRQQGDPPAVKVSPRFGLTYQPVARMVVRGGYGIYWAPWNFQPATATNYGQIGFSRQTFIQQDQFVPTTTIDNPFPAGALRPIGNALGALAGVGGQIDFIDQTKRAPWVQQYSVDVTRQLTGAMAAGLEYSGATGRALGLGGSSDGVININQLDPVHLALGPALLAQVPNPFFGLPAGQGFAVTSPTVQRRQLLRPFPQFGDIFMRQSTRGRSQYHALVVKLERRMSRGWGFTFNYTYSRLTDNQFGETNFYQGVNANALNAYDLSREYAVSLLDVPHRVAFAPVGELPFGAGKPWLRQGLGARLLGGITLSSIIVLESGFPVPVASLTNNTNLFTLAQRPNPTGASPVTRGSRTERILKRWLDPAAYAVPAAFTLGTAPRTDPRVRGPHRNNWDLMASKAVTLREGLRVELRYEMLNVTNTVKVVGPNHQVGSSNFGQIQTQAGWMRMSQYMLRVTF